MSGEEEEEQEEIGVVEEEEGCMNGCGARGAWMGVGCLGRWARCQGTGWGEGAGGEGRIGRRLMIGERKERRKSPAVPHTSVPIAPRRCAFSWRQVRILACEKDVHLYSSSIVGDPSTKRLWRC